MRGPENPIQLQLGEERKNTSSLHEVADQAHSHIILYITEGRRMKQCAASLRGILKEREMSKEEGRQVRLIHHHQLIFKNLEEWGDGFRGYEDPPTISQSEGLCITIVENFRSFDEGEMVETMEKLNKTKDLVTWIFLVPYWRQIKQSQVLLAWAREKKAKIIHLNPDKEED